ncbi:MAG: serine/threonine protein phosphatase [Clostridiales bacterium]|nr:serine/threonine protein phosphatase [Clostridiales bacterium]
MEITITRTILISDIHGCYNELRRLLEKVHFSTREDRLILLGDLFDRGSGSFEVYCFVKRLKEQMKERCILIRGNHEDMFLRAEEEEKAKRMWLRNGGIETCESFRQHQADINECASFIEKNTVLYYIDDRFQCVHAGLDSENPENNDPHTLLWNGYVTDNYYEGKLTMVGHVPLLNEVIYLNGDSENNVNLPLHEMIRLPETGMIFLDGGCVFGGRLTAMVIGEGCFYVEAVMYGE